MSFRIHCTPDGLTRYPMHKHKNYEIMTYLEGEGVLRTATGDVAFSEGTVIIVPPEVEHGSVSRNGFKNISIEGTFEGYLNLDRVTSFSDNDGREGRTLAKLIYDNRYGSGAYLSSLCTTYVCFLMQGFEIENALRQSIQRMIGEISEHAFDPELSLANILAKSGYCEDYVRASFKRVTAKTPHEFLSDIRIKHACRMIDIYKHDLSLSEIAERCGYLDYVYFSKKFKAIMGVSPKVYRDQ